MSTPISLEYLEFFTEIIDCGGLLEVAAQLNIPPSAVNKSLTAIEDMLGTTLTKRTIRNITLTDVGQYLFNRANKLLKEFDETLSTTSGYYYSPQGELRTTCSIASGYSRLMSLVDKYRSQFPDVNPYIDLNDNFANLNETDFDIALRVPTAPPQDYAICKLVPVRWAYCASPGYLARKGIPQRQSDLVDHDCLVYPGLTPVLKVADERNCSHRLRLRMPIQANSSLVLLKSVLEDQGVAHLLTYLTGDHTQKEEIALLMPNGTITCETHALYALYFPSERSNSKARSFIDFLVAELGSLSA